MRKLLALCAVCFMTGCTGFGFERTTSGNDKTSHTSGHFWSLDGQAVGDVTTFIGETVSALGVPGMSGIAAGVGGLAFLFGHKRGHTARTKQQTEIDAAWDEAASRKAGIA